MDYWIKDSALVETFTDFADTPTTTYSASYGSDLCGSKTMEIYMYDYETLMIGQITGGSYQETVFFTDNDYDWLTYSYDSGTSEHSFSIYSDDPSDYTNSYATFYIKVMLDDYYLLYPETIHWESFQIRLKNC